MVVYLKVLVCHICRFCLSLPSTFPRMKCSDDCRRKTHPHQILCAAYAISLDDALCMLFLHCIALNYVTYKHDILLSQFFN